MNNKSDSDGNVFDDILFSSDEELAQRQTTEQKNSESSMSPPILAPADKELKPEQQHAKAQARENALLKAKQVSASMHFEEDQEDSQLEEALFSDETALEQAQDKKPVANPLIASDDYADVEVEAEDALFSSDAELEQALDAMPQQIKVKPKLKKSRSNLDAGPAKIHFDQFTYSEQSPIALQTLAATSGLSVIAKRLNLSVMAEVDWQVPEQVDEELAAEIEQIKSNKIAEREAERQQQAEKPQTKKALLQQIYKGGKSKFDDYFGRTLPDREIPLNFKFPPSISAKDAETLLTSHQIQDIFSKKKDSLITVFKKSERALETISIRDLSAAKQEHLLSAFYPNLLARVLNFIAGLQKKPSLPFTEERKEASELCILCVKHAVSAYKQLYSFYYESNNVLYAQKHDVANLTAWRLAELLCLEQRLHAALYRSHGNASSLSFNKIFNVLSIYEQDYVFEQRHSDVFSCDMSLQQMFMLFQIELAFDLTLLSASLHRIVRQYYLDLSALILPLTAQQLSSAWVDACWIISHEHSGRARFDVDTTINQLPAAYFHIEPFLQQIKKDYVKSLELLKQHSFKGMQQRIGITAFDLVSAENILQILAALNQQILGIEKNVVLPKYSVYKKFPVDIDVVVGFDQAINSLKRIYTGHAEAHLKGSLAKPKEQSVISSKNKRGAAGAYWDVAAEAPRAIYLQTSETKACPSLDVGDLMVLVKYLEDVDEIQLQANALAAEKVIPLRVSAIERGISNHVAITTEKLAEEATSVTLNMANNVQVKALLAKQAQQHVLIVAAKHPLSAGTECQLTLLDGSTVIVIIAGLQSISAQLQVYSIFFKAVE